LEKVNDPECRFLIIAMWRRDYPVRTAITFMKMGKTFWTRANWRRVIKASIVLPAIAQSFESIWNKLSTTNASAVIQGFRKKRKRQAHDFVDNVM
jgi:hypothetical protein